MLYAEKIKIINNAIKEHAQIEFDYECNGLIEHGKRQACPHVLYINKHSETCLDAFQVYGVTNSELQQWKIFKIARITDLQIVPETFKTHTQYNAESIRYLNYITKIEE